MASVNKVILVGNLGADPELRYTPSGQAVCNMRIATNAKWVDKSGAKQERTDWHRVKVWGRRAETCQHYLHKGRSVYVEGRLLNNKYTDRNGVERWGTEVVSQQVQFLGSRREGPDDATEESPTNPALAAAPTDRASNPSADQRGDELPF